MSSLLWGAKQEFDQGAATGCVHREYLAHVPSCSTGASYLFAACTLHAQVALE